MFIGNIPNDDKNSLVISKGTKLVDLFEKLDVAGAISRKIAYRESHGLSLTPEGVYTRQKYGSLEMTNLCPKCNKEMRFYINGNIAGALGVFECECGYKNEDISNINYATNEDWDRFWKNTEGIEF